MLTNLINAMEHAIQELKQWPEKSVQVFHHNDSDGLTSGTILTRAFERQGYVVQRFCLEKPYPAVLRKVYEQKGKILIFADFAGRIAPLLSELNKGRNLTLILDHHVAEASTDPRVHNLDPDLYGLKGDRDISGSTTCYLFALAMDSVNRDMAHIAAVGAVGDGFFVNGQLVSQNREVALEAVKQGLIEIRKHETWEQYLLKSSKGQINCIEFGDYLDILGGVGYYQKGPDMGIRVCLEGVSPESDRMVEELKVIRTKIFNEEIARLQAGALQKTPRIQWFHVEKRFFPMGVKMIGAFCDAIKDTDLIDPMKYLAGFQVIPDEIPGFGAITFNEVKISMRVSPYMEGEIRAGRATGLNIFLPEATNKLGGFSDACHSLTAATTVAIGKEEKLIEEMEKILKGDS
ncbi:MAG: DHH family phosphoesterase [Anaerolineaceae bacterium]|nr:MAG: DHH family phosphoesterase [Anaerolineaceae bacterium]